MFPDERLWQVNGDIKNSSGNLALHITGNLKHFIGAMLGGTGHVRQRDKEFSNKHVPKVQLLQGLDEAPSLAKHYDWFKRPLDQLSLSVPQLSRKH